MILVILKAFLKLIAKNQIMQIKQEGNQESGRFVTEDGLGEIIYSKAQDGVITVEHTEVDSSLKGKGVGKQLVHAIADWARKENLKLIPQCTYARAVMQRDPSFKDVLYPV